MKADFLPGMKTLFGLVLMAFGTLAQMNNWEWWGQVAGDAEVLVNQVLQISGVLVSLYGTFMKMRREKALKAELALK